MASPPFNIATTTPISSDLISIWPTQEPTFRDIVNSWLTLLSDPTTGLLKPTAFTFPFSISNAGTGTFFELISTDPGGNEGPSMSLYRNSASPAASDVMGVLRWYGQNSAAAKKEYGHIRIDIADPVSTTEDGTMRFILNVAGTLTERLTMNAAGLTVGGTITYAGAIAGLTGTGALTSGSIGSGFGTINIGANSLTAGAASFTSMASSGAVSGTTATFSAGVSGTTGTFSSNVSVSGNLTSTGGNIQATAGSIISGSTVFALISAGTMVFRPNGVGSTTGQMLISAAGNVTAAGDITASSDRRLKKSISPLNHQWANDMVAEVQPKTFLRKKNDQRGIGFIAQEVQHYAPELIQTDARGYLSLAYPNMVAILWAVVQDLQKKVTELEAK